MSLREVASRIRIFTRDWSDASASPRLRRPEVIQFPINDVCNSRCQMCNIWTLRKSNEVQPAEVRRILSNPLFSRVTSIGFNGGEPTLRKDFQQLTLAAIESLPRLRGVSLITNAILESRTRDCIDQLAENCDRSGVKLDVMVSIDGVGAVHDRVRGVDGNFSSASRVIDHLLARPDRWSIRIGCTVVRENVFDLENVLAWAMAKGVQARFRIGIPHQRLRSEDITSPFALDDGERFHFCNFLDGLRANYEKDPARRDFYLSLRNQIAYGKPRQSGCMWKNRGMTLLPDGGLAYCAVKSPRLGSAIDTDPGALYWGGIRTLEAIQRDSCGDCRHDYDGIGNRRSLLRMAFNKHFDPGSPIRKALSWSKQVRSAGRNLASRLHAAPIARNAGTHSLVVGWYGTETTGDKAILGSIVQMIRSRSPKARISVASLEPYVTIETRRQMPELEGVEIVDLSEARSGLLRGEYSEFIFGGGPLMSTIGELPELVHLAGIANRVGAKVVVAGCGIGPLGVPKGDQAIRALLRLADSVVLRDSGSLLAASSLGVERDIGRAYDPAFLWVEANRAPNTVVENKLVLALRDWPIDEYARGNAQAKEIKSKFDRQIIEFIETVRRTSPETVIQPVCMHRLPVGGDDLLYYDGVLNDFDEIRRRIPTRHQTPLETLREFESASGVLAMRYHSVVFGLALRRPMVVVDYTSGGKTASLLKDVGARPSIPISSFSGVDSAAELLVGTKHQESVAVDLQDSTRIYASLF